MKKFNTLINPNITNCDVLLDCYQHGAEKYRAVVHCNMNNIACIILIKISDKVLYYISQEDLNSEINNETIEKC